MKQRLDVSHTEPYPRVRSIHITVIYQTYQQIKKAAVKRKMDIGDFLVHAAMCLDNNDKSGMLGRGEQ